MIKLSGCIEMLFSEIETFADRIPAAADAGLDAVEFWGYSNKDLDAVVAACEKHKMPVSSLVVENPRGMLDLNLADGFADAVGQACAAAEKLGTKRLICTVGQEREDVDRGWQHAGIVACLRAAAPVAEAAGVTLVLEPLNTLVDHVGYFLWSSREGFEILDEVNHPHVKLLYDIYHQQVMEGNLIATITSHVDQIGHLHAADVPGRHEPGIGEINWPNLLAAINESGYEGYIALEYKPTGPTRETLKYILGVRDQING